MRTIKIADAIHQLEKEVEEILGSAKEDYQITVKVRKLRVGANVLVGNVINIQAFTGDPEAVLNKIHGFTIEKEHGDLDDTVKESIARLISSKRIYEEKKVKDETNLPKKRSQSSRKHSGNNLRKSTSKKSTSKTRKK